MNTPEKDASSAQGIGLVRTALRYPVATLVLVAALCLGALLGLQRMSRDVFPPLGVPTIYVAQPYGGMDPAQMEGYLTYYYEYHFLYITGIEHVESKSIQGASIMKLQFHPGTDMSAALAETISYVNRARAFMPPGTVPPFVTRFDAGSVPVGNLVFSTENPARTVGQMQDAALNMVRPLFATLSGVSAPPPFGGSARSILINVKPDRMRAYGISPDEIVTAMTKANVISPSGNMNLGDKYPIVPVNAVVKQIKDLETVPLRVNGISAVMLRDVATVEDASDLVTSFALVNGRRTVYIPVTKRADASTLAVVDLVKANMAKFQAAVPDDVKVSFEFDQTPVVWRSIKNVVHEGGLGALLTGLMVLLFLRDWRSAFVVTVNIPIALLAACFALWVSGQSVNLMTLGGLALAVGILVDEATVTVENIHTHLARGRPIAQAALLATRETAQPRLLAMLCILAVFVPAFFMVGAAKALFTPLALAVGFAMVASYFLSSTLAPILSVWFLKGHEKDASSDITSGFARVYASLMDRLMILRWPVALLYIGGCLFGTWLILGSLGLEIFPRSDSGQFALRFRAPTGTRVENTEGIALRVLDIIKRETGADKVALTMGLVGVHAPNYPVNLIHLWNGGPEEGWLAVAMKPDAHVNVPDLKERLRTALNAELPGVKFSFEPSDIVSRVMSFGSNTPIEVAVNGPDLAASREYADRLLVKLAALPELRDLQFGQALDFPTVDVTVNREKAGMLGVQMADVTRSLVAATTSSRFTVANYWSDSKTGVSYNLQVQIPQTRTQTLEDLRNIPVQSSMGEAPMLRSVASIVPGTAVGQYERYNMARVISISANIHGRDVGSTAARIERAIAELGPPPARTNVALRGQVPPLRELASGFRSGLIVAIVVVFLMLAANFQSVRLALCVLCTLPAVLLGVGLALLLTGTTLNIQSAIGAIMAIGVALANAILLVTFAERFRLAGADARTGAVQGATSRLRPILMTSFAMAAGMLPMALGFGEAGEQTAPLGRAVLGGLIAATAATLFMLPLIFAVLRGRATRNSRSLDATDPDSPHFSPTVESIAHN